MIKQESVFPPARQQVQSDANAPEKILALDESFQFVFTEEIMGYQVVQGSGAKMPFGNPADNLDVTQAAGIFLYIGFQVIGGITEPVVTLNLFRQFGLKKFAAGPDLFRSGFFFAA